MNFRVEALEPELFRPLFDLDDAALESRSVKRYTVDGKPGFPCRVSLADAEIGEEVLLLSFAHHDVDSPYRGDGPILVRRYAAVPMLGINELPQHLEQRTLSLRGYDSEGMMVDAMVTPGSELDGCIRTLLDQPEVVYVHVHNADRGCFLCCIRRVVDEGSGIDEESTAA